MEKYFFRKSKMRIAESFKFASLGGLENSYVDGSLHLKPVLSRGLRDFDYFRVRSRRKAR